MKPTNFGIRCASFTSIKCSVNVSPSFNSGIFISITSKVMAIAKTALTQIANTNKPLTLLMLAKTIRRLPLLQAYMTARCTAKAQNRIKRANVRNVVWTPNYKRNNTGRRCAKNWNADNADRADFKRILCLFLRKSALQYIMTIFLFKIIHHSQHIFL